jgi:two-component system, OmpR family, sensor histidine kinase KdpD
MPRVLRFLLALAVIAAVSTVAWAIGADLAAAASILLVAVVLLSLLGLPVALFSAAAAFVVLNLVFTAPTGSFRIAKHDDLIALVVFVVAAAVVGTVVNLLDRARRDAQRRAAETRLRLDVTNRLTEGASLDVALPEIATALCRLFELASCRITSGTVDVTVGAPLDGDGSTPEADRAHNSRNGRDGHNGRRLHIDSGPLSVDARPRHPLSPNDRDLFEALVAGVATAIDRLRLQAEAHEARVAAEVGETRAAFLSGVSHNLRTPLSALKAAAITLLSSNARLRPEERVDLIEMIRDESERLERLVRNTLAMSRIKGEVLVAHPEAVDVEELVGIALRRVAPLATAHQLRASISENVREVRIDPTLVEHVLLNLIENALRFAPAGSEIVVEACVDRERGGALVIRVIDHGPGVPPELRERIFEEFTTGSERVDTGGSGLGLTIVLALVGAHRGTVQVEDTPGGGATFVCTFPQEAA